MRGRTNITPRKEPIINGQLISATVETGNTISVGDFVEYKVDYSETATQDYNASVTIIDELETANYKILLIAKNSQVYLELFKKSTQERVDSIVIDSNHVSYCNMDLVDDTHLIVKNYNCVYSYIGITNDSFDIIQTLTKYNASYPIVGVIDSSHFGGFIKEVSSNTYYIGIDIFSFDSNGITFVEHKSFSSGSSSNINPPTYVKKVASNRIMVFGTSTSSSSDVYLASFDSSYNFSRVAKTSFSSVVEKLRVNDVMFAFLNYSNSSSTDTFVLYLIKYDSTSDTISTYLQLNLATIFGGNFYHNRNMCAISLLNENQLAIIGCIDFNNSPRKGVILSYDDTDDSYSVSDAIQVSNLINFTDVKFAVADSDDARLFTDVSYIKLKIQDDAFENTPNTNYVKSYTGGKAIGFAKTAGSAGQTVSVYVPVV